MNPLRSEHRGWIVSTAKLWDGCYETVIVHPAPYVDTTEMVRAKSERGANRAHDEITRQLRSFPFHTNDFEPARINVPTADFVNNLTNNPAESLDYDR